MNGRRTVYEIYWEILVYCRTPRAFTAIVSRCDLNSQKAQEYLEFLVARGYITVVSDNGKNRFRSTGSADEYITLFSSLYQKLFDEKPGFRL
jgi:predicted transcriptional regulator